MAGRKAVLSTSEVRREAVIRSAMAVFAVNGYLGTPVTDIAKRARISPAYVFKLFPSKEELFVAALERCFELILEALAKGADESTDQTPDTVLFAMGGAYAALIANRNLLLLQIHAQSAATVPPIAKAFRKGLEAITRFVKDRSQAPDEMVQRFMAYGQLCHLITTMGLEKDPAPWAQVLTNGFRHP
ncbi:MAG: TetR/AcrR family transcriptional regulator [Janthinobacterium lividum]